MTPFRDLPETEQTRLRDVYALEMAKQSNTCSMDEKISRFHAWLEPQGISFTLDDLRLPKRG
ncbi:hypothetical protein [Celeribacter litoreus]|uniref:hypothetical protein n=1 Tax=Celeribacter litoreus TaxID=2876714 RepID=UPI001CC9D17D|nr:hypothetical protein [Celeribacter litoreus]MCA0042605.1 hypothetical protein [Celeribacter litoreus]